jgi:hypothetical protein
MASRRDSASERLKKSIERAKGPSKLSLIELGREFGLAAPQRKSNDKHVAGSSRPNRLHQLAGLSVLAPDIFLNTLAQPAALSSASWAAKF